MRILHVRFENLNSLEGRWHIDFTHPAYQANPIFAITGPTGSGKTTLLDAICLALYGRTPRLKIISKSVNEVLTRQTGACFAEVTFETVNGIFRCHWSQHRSRKKSSGDLQQPRHEIVDHSTNAIIENKIKNVAKAVEEVTGLTFNQFTRAILLAQGSFATFLQAHPDDRAPLLEQITGTEIFSRISQKIYEITTQREKVFHEKNKAVDSLAILSADEEKQHIQNLENILFESQTIQQQINTLNSQIAWREKLSSLRSEIASLKSEQKVIDNLLNDQIQQRIQLNRAILANRFVSQYEIIQRDRKIQQSELEELKEIQKARNQLEQSFKTLSQQFQTIEIKRIEAEEKLKKERELGKTVRELDVKIKEYSVNQKSEENKINQIKLQLITTEDSLSTLNSRLAAAKKNLQTCKEYLEKNMVDAKLVEHFALLEEMTHQRAAITGKIDEYGKIQKQLIVEKQDTEERLSTSVKHLDTLRNELKRLQKDYDDTARELQEIQKQNLHVHEEMENNRNISALLGKLELQILDAQIMSTDIKKRQEEIERYTITLRKEKEHEKSLSIKIADQERLVQKQEEIVYLSNRISSYEEERLILRKGLPCPLCGATEHPFCDVSPKAQYFGSKDTLIKEKETLQELQKSYLEIKEKIAGRDASLQSIKSEMENLNKRLATTNREITALISEGGFLENYREMKFLNKEKQRIDEQQKTLLHILKHIENLKMNEGQTRDHLDACKQTISETERIYSKIEYKYKRDTQNIDDLNTQLIELTEQLDMYDAKLKKSLQSYGITKSVNQILKDTLDDLSRRRMEWEKHQKQEHSLQLEVKELEGEGCKFDELQKKLNQNLLEQQDILKRLGMRLKVLADERSTLYENKNPDIEENKLLEQITTLISQMKDCTEKLESCKTGLTRKTERSAQLKTTTDKRDKTLQEEHASFLHNIKAEGFDTDTHFASALLSTEKISQIENSVKQLDSRAEKNSTLLEEKKQSQKTEQSKALTTADTKTLQERLDALHTKLQELFQGKGRIQAILEENIKSIAQQKNEREKLNKLKQDLTQWQKMNNLIGSANGKKFRNFAQGITFDIVAALANSNLQKMSDRYILVRDRNHPLELNIIDNYRAGDIRSTKNLSGGESFLVSLALALGLSNMAGDNIRVDSLFLDEGFGTLDEDTLETALQTLSSLQRDGKMIGIISHIPLLKERIETQIQVIPGQGGHSTLNGPGIRSL